MNAPVIIALTLAIATVAHAQGDDAPPAPPQNLQIYLASRLIEARADTILDPGDTGIDLTTHTTLTDPQLTDLLRALSQQKDVNLLSAPGIVTRHSHRAKIEIIKEVTFPSGLNEGELEFDSINAGVTLDLDPEISTDNDDTHLIRIVGSVVVRAPDGAAFSRAADIKDIVAADPREDPTPNSAISFLTSETVFDIKLRDGETALLVCNKRKDKTTRLIAAITARIMDAAGRFSDQPDFGTPPETIHLDQPVSYEGYLVSGDALATDPLLAPQQWNDLDKPALALAGILSEIEFTRYLDQLRAKPNLDIKQLKPSDAMTGEKATLGHGRIWNTVKGLATPNSLFFDLSFTPAILEKPSDQAPPPSDTTTTDSQDPVTNVTIMNGQWVAFYAPAVAPIDKPTALFIRAHSKPQAAQQTAPGDTE